ncbi:MAG TPA: aconitate hydratase AcnA [Anaerolineae bacterium]|nr:aconitate hydratase AcnA [Anaerolineae bacterium]
MEPLDLFDARAVLETAAGPVTIYRLGRLVELGLTDLDRLPFSIRIWLEGLLRRCDGREITEEHVRRLAAWRGASPGEWELPFRPARVLLQDFTGVPAVVDLAALRSAMHRLGGEPRRINPQVPVDLVIDHSVQVDAYGSAEALAYNARREFERNRERYEFLRWAQDAFDNFRVVPPATGIVHQVNLEYLATVVVRQREPDGGWLAFPDTLVGTDSHTTMINGLGVMGWGVGGIEAEAAMLGEPITLLPPEVIGLELVGELPEGATATDLVLTVTQVLRQKGVVGKFVEFFGPGVARLSLPDRATLANMAPEYGATMGFFPVDEETLRYLRQTGRPAELVDLVERYTKAQSLFRRADAPPPDYSDTLTLDLGAVEPSLAGPRRPQDRIPLAEMKRAFRAAFGQDAVSTNGQDTILPNRQDAISTNGQDAILPNRQDAIPANGQDAIPTNGQDAISTNGQDAISTNGQDAPDMSDGAVVIAAITSCTNTSNPSVMIAAGLLAKKAVERGLRVPSYVKTSLAPGSRVVSRYLEAAGLRPYLDQLGFQVVGYGCTTCIGNSGPLPEKVVQAIEERDLVAAAVLSGNRNFEGRISPYVRANYLASPPLVVAYALAGRVDVDLRTEPLGRDPDGQPVYLRDIWPGQDEIQAAVAAALDPQLFIEQYADVFRGNEMWNAIPTAAATDLYAWDPDSTYIQEPPFWADLPAEPPPLADIHGARVLVLLGDSVTTDHISPAGSIAPDSPAGRYLLARGVQPPDFNSYGSRRGNHQVMMRGTFANVRLRNRLVPGSEGNVTRHFPDGEEMSIYDAAMRYRAEGVPLLVLAGRQYGTGSSRDWAAKGVHLLGVQAVLARSYERIHRSNLIGMGVLPLQFMAGESVESLGLTGREVFDIEGLAGGLKPGQVVAVRARRDDGSEIAFEAVARLDTPAEIEYYRHGGILHTVLRRMVRAGG